MATSDHWRELAERCAKAKGPDREIDDAIWWPVLLQDAITHREINGRRECNVTAYWQAIGRTDIAPDWRPLGPYAQPPEYTRSLDAICALIERELPGWSILMAANPDKACADIHTAPLGVVGLWPAHGSALTAPLALCAAFCLAKVALAETEQTKRSKALDDLAMIDRDLI